jgi:hypothetical protein
MTTEFLARLDKCRVSIRYPGRRSDSAPKVDAYFLDQREGSHSKRSNLPLRLVLRAACTTGRQGRSSSARALSSAGSIVGMGESAFVNRMAPPRSTAVEWVR